MVENALNFKDVERQKIIKEIEMLKDHAHLAANQVDVDLGVSNDRAVKGDRSCCGEFHLVQATQEG